MRDCEGGVGQQFGTRRFWEEIPRDPGEAIPSQPYRPRGPKADYCLPITVCRLLNQNCALFRFSRQSFPISLR